MFSKVVCGKLHAARVEKISAAAVRRSGFESDKPIVFFCSGRRPPRRPWGSQGTAEAHRVRRRPGHWQSGWLQGGGVERIGRAACGREFRGDDC